MDEQGRKNELRWKIMRFLRSRRSDETRKYVGSIIDVLEKAREEDSQKKIRKGEAGWIRVKVLLNELVGPDKEIKNQTTFYRLVNDLSLEKIIERRTVPIPEEQMRSATFYRTSDPYQRWWFLSREQLEEKYTKSQLCVRELIQHLVIARDLLEEMGCPDPQQKIADDYKLLYDRAPISDFKVIPPPPHEGKYTRMPFVKLRNDQIPVRRKLRSSESFSKNKSE